MVPIQLKDVGCVRFYNRVCLAQTFGLNYIFRSTTTTSECFEFMGRDVKTEHRKILLNFWQFSLTEVFLYTLTCIVCQKNESSVYAKLLTVLCLSTSPFLEVFSHLSPFWGAFKRLFVYIIQYFLVYHRRFIMSLNTGSKRVVSTYSQKKSRSCILSLKCCSNVCFCSNISSRQASIGHTGTEIFPVTVAEMTLRNKKPHKTISFNNGLRYCSLWCCTAGSQKCMC